MCHRRDGEEEDQSAACFNYGKPIFADSWCLISNMIIKGLHDDDEACGLAAAHLK